MEETYFQRLHRLSDNRFWVNNPTPEQAELAIGAGAFACTTNPTYASKQYARRDSRERVAAYVREAAAEEKDEDEAADRIQRKCVADLLIPFSDVYKKSGGKAGFVSIQGNPYRDGDAEWILEETRRYFALGENVIAKIPVTGPGLLAIETLLSEGRPVIATEVMSLSQALLACEACERAAGASGTRPPFFLTHITGIFDQYIQDYAGRNGIAIDRDILFQAGVLLARRQYGYLRERGYGHITLLGGGARGPHHFTEMVGSPMHVTINWEPTALELMETNPPVLYRMETPIPEFMARELSEKLPPFRTAWEPDGLGTGEFEDFGPVKLFRSMFCEGWTELRNAVRNAG